MGEIEVWKKGVTAVTAKTWAPLFAKIDEPTMKILRVHVARLNSVAHGSQVCRRGNSLDLLRVGRDWSTVAQTNTFPSTNDPRAAVVNGLQKKNEKLMKKSVFSEKVSNSRPNTPVGAASP
ncbi:predicted protein [Histoplasma capsulatum G186AR]|uniref:Uncharacterized protein n=1 Tax=Ajellomyces capsulatus (strain G186AR / H82 / ATCC MYA-2454 / RMSCC 2432) TaxID=447093 RepID=C0NTV1_AJECG|nr:uncharacterized protein HCBG_06581 [Histoplasma capsulatum G186AR]EEH05462.1 predicted protein [Histoplasma capsulatum G186AR]